MNAYIYALARPDSDLDSELFNLDRIKAFDIFSPTIRFEHASNVVHQNYLTRNVATNLKQAPTAPIANAVKKEPTFKNEIKKNEVVKPAAAVKTTVDVKKDETK